MTMTKEIYQIQISGANIKEAEAFLNLCGCETINKGMCIKKGIFRFACKSKGSILEHVKFRHVKVA